MTNIKGLRLGVVALVAGGALTGGLLFGGALVSAQTPSDTPAAEDTETPADTTTPQVAPDANETPTDKGGTTPDASHSDTDKAGRDGECDKGGDGQSDARPEGGTRFNGAPSDGAGF
jgi:hypothetical protein